MSSFNAFTQKKRTGYAGGVPVWLGTVTPRPVGGTIPSDFQKAGLLVPAGTPVCFNESAKTVTPIIMWEVVSLTAGDTNDTLVIKPCVYGDVAILPTTSDKIQKLGSTFASTAKAAAVAAIAENSTTAGQYDVTILHSATIDSVSAGDFIVLSTATSAGSSKSMKDQPNAYLYNDIAIENLLPGETYESKTASAAVVEFHAEGILINRTNAAPVKAQMKSAVPMVIQVGY